MQTTVRIFQYQPGLPIQSNRSIFGQSTIQGRTIDYFVHNPIEIINPSCIIDFFGLFWIDYSCFTFVFYIPQWKLQIVTSIEEYQKYKQKLIVKHE